MSQTSAQLETFTFTNSGSPLHASALVDQINHGEIVEIGGRDIVNRFGRPAMIFQNGTVAVDVRARSGKPGSIGTVFVKVGQSVTYR